MGAASTAPAHGLLHDVYLPNFLKAAEALVDHEQVQGQTGKNPATAVQIAGRFAVLSRR